MSLFSTATVARFRSFALRAPRRPRHPLLRAVFGLIGIALLLVLVVAGLAVGLIMLLLGTLWRGLAGSNARHRIRSKDRTLDGQYRIVQRPSLAR